MGRKLKSFLSTLIAAFLLATLIIPIAACQDGEGNGGNTVVSVVSMGNRGLSDVTVTAKNGSSVVTGRTNTEGKASLKLDKSLTYQVSFDNLPKGYYSDPDANYSIKANSSLGVKFYMPSKVIVGESVDSTYVYKTGDVMYDFSFTTTVGKKVITLSEELETKKAVLINFWGSLCSNCQLEFPAIESTYQMFQDKLTVMAIDPPSAYGDDDNEIISILSQWRLNLSFYYGLDSAGIYKNIYAPAQNNKFALPVSVIVDRYGVICDIIVGSEADEKIWQETIAKYVSDDYVPDIKDGQTSDDVENFEPDLPADFGAKMPDSATINKAINKTGTDILFHADEADYSWPWTLSSSGDSIVPLGSGHGRSYSIIYAEVNMEANQALLVDYRISSQEDYDLFEIVVDNNDLGKVTFIDSGNKDWQTALAYIPLSAGNHQIAFVYYKGTISGKYEDTVEIKNLRFVSATSEQIPSSDVSYFAARDYNATLSTYNTYEDVYFDNTDGYYHINGRKSAGKDPYLLFDMTHIIPYTRSNSFYEAYISEKKCTFGNKNYYNELMSYGYVAGNSAIEGVVPVTKEVHDILVALCKHEYGSDVFEENPDMWLEFCVFYLHFGSGDSIEDPAKGLAYFSAYEAKLTDVYDTKLAMEQINTILNAQKEIANNPNANKAELEALIKSTQDEYESNLAKYNSVDFDTLIIPRGKLVKFTAPEAGVYHFYSVGREDNAEYICEAQLFTSDLKLHTALSKPVASHDSDTLFRDGSPSQFHLYHYLNEGESCYLNLMFYSTETIDTMYYAINKIHDTEYKVLKTVTAGFLTTSLDKDTMGQLYRPIFPKKGIEYRETEGYYFEKDFGHEIYVDFTGITRYSTSHTLEQVIKAVAAGNPLKVGTVDVNFDLTGVQVQIGRRGDPNYEVINGKDYTDAMNSYLAAATANPDDPDYGLVKANKELREILLLFITKYDELTVEEDWLMFCYYYEYFGANY